MYNNNKNFDGVMSKILDTQVAKKYGWKPKISFDKAIIQTYEDLKSNIDIVRNI